MKGQRAHRRTKRCRQVYLKKLALVVLAIVLTAGLSITLGSDFVEADNTLAADTSYEKCYKSIVIETGDTLWNIAEEYKGSNEGISDYIEELVRLNDLNTDQLQEGQYLTVAYYDVI